MNESSPARRATDGLEDQVASVLVVDDSRAIRTILARTLVAAGYSVREAADGREALEHCREQAPDLVLLDVDMPVMDGMATMEAMLEDPALTAIPVLFLTARTGSDDAARGLDLGARDYLRKPCEPAELLARVSTTLRLQARERRLERRAARADDLSTKDPLTGLANRRGLDAWLGTLGSESAPKAEIGIAMLDLDHFKAVNDTYGHGVGDAVLQVVGARLKSKMDDRCVVSRWGGEEFVAVHRAVTPAELLDWGEELRVAIANEPLAVGLDEPLSVTVSVGCAMETVAHFEGTISRADAALYQAKKLGRNQVRLADE